MIYVIFSWYGVTHTTILPFIDVVLVNVYMPNDDNSTESFELFGDILYEISAIVNTYESSNIIIGGD